MSLRAVTTVIAVVLTACAGSEPGLTVGGVSFTREQLLGLTPDHQRLLAGITAVGLAVSDDEVALLGGEWLEERRQELLTDKLEDDVIVEASDADDETLRAHYLTNPEYELTVRHIVALSERWESDAERDEARNRIGEALERIDAGEPFPELAAELSEEPGADRRGGRLEPGRRGSWVPEFWQAASSLEEGRVSGVVESPYGFHVIKLEERDTVAFEEARYDVVAEIADLVGSREAWLRWADSAVAARFDGADAPTPEARRDFLAREARIRGITVSEREEERIRRQWQEMVMRWAATLGLHDARPTDLGDAALEALSATGQNARLVRGEIEEFLPTLLAAYEVRGLDATRDEPRGETNLPPPT